jgi:HAD superfamily hydrolase (TIGR01509 family)
MTEAIFFDFDGVVIDSEPIHVKTKALALDAYSIEYPEDIFERYKGMPEDRFFIYVSEHLDSQHRHPEVLLKTRQEILSDYLSEIPFVNGFLDFLEYVKSKGILTALVTSSTAQELKNLDHYLNILSMFNPVISAEATPEHKPHPAPYIKALEMMQANKENVVVIEDSPNGIISGKKAGCRVFALTTSFSKDELAQAGADLIFENYEQLMEVL